MVFFICYCVAKAPSDPNISFVDLISNAEGSYYMTAKSNTYYVAIDADNNIQALLDSELISVS